MRLIDELANLAGRTTVRLGGALRLMQSGLIQHYASLLLLGVVFILLAVAMG